MLDVIDVASPCHVAWESMQGDDRVRHCSQCRLNVYNLSDMRRGDAEALVREHEGRLCVRFFRRADGTVLTRDCPWGLRAVRQRMARMVAAAAALVGLISITAAFGRSKPADGEDSELVSLVEVAPQPLGPLQSLVHWLAPPEEGYVLAGSLICVPSDVRLDVGTDTKQPPTP